MRSRCLQLVESLSRVHQRTHVGRVYRRFTCSVRSRAYAVSHLEVGPSVSIGLLAASITGALRIVGEQHYFSDVLAGAVSGFLSGFMVPVFVYPRAL